MPEHDIETCECQGCGGDVPVLDAILLPEFPNRPNPDAKQYCCVACYEFSEKQKLSTLARYAKAIAKVVEAGGPRPEHGIGFVCLPSGNWMPVLQTTDSFDGREWLITAGLEKYVREDVVVWASENICQVAEPMYIGDDTWLWEIEYERYSTCDGTHMIQFIEMIAEVVAGEKVNTRLDSDESSSGEVG